MNEPTFDRERNDWSNIRPRGERSILPPKLHVYSARCAWSGPINKVGHTKGAMSLPCCPHCGSVLFQVDEEEWWTGAKQHEDNGHTNYLEMLHWKEDQDRCWPTFEDAAKAFTEATGKTVILRLPGDKN